MEDKTLTSLSDIPTGSLLYFVGVGGISMCGLAQFAWHMGFQVAGSDRQASEHTELLSDMGIQVFIGHDSARVDALKPFALIHTAAVHRDNPEWRRAIELGIPVMERSVFLGLITRDFKRVINIAGTHGKTTTTAMCSTILLASGADPTIHLGAALKSLDSNTVRMGAPRELLVSEACEYSNSYHEFTSTTATILNIDIDHMDFFRDLDDLLDSFARFTDKIVEGGTLVLPHWGRYMPDLLSRIIKRRAAMSRDLVNVVTFGAHRAPFHRITPAKSKRTRTPESPTIWPGLLYIIIEIYNMRTGCPVLIFIRMIHSSHISTCRFRESTMSKTPSPRWSARLEMAPMSPPVKPL